MPKDIYTTKFCGEIYKIRANFAQASDPVEMLNCDFEWQSTGRQVADCSHDPTRAMRSVLAQSVIDSGDAWPGVEAEIDAAIDASKWED